MTKKLPPIGGYYIWGDRPRLALAQHIASDYPVEVRTIYHMLEHHGDEEDMVRLLLDAYMVTGREVWP